VDKLHEDQPIAFLSQKRDGHIADKNRIVYIPVTLYKKTCEIFTSADGNRLWHLSPCAISFRNNSMLLIQPELNGQIMLYHLELGRHYNRLPPEALRLVDP
jgi:hypothetical protein